MKPARNPARRNRNGGTVKHGRGQDNKLVVPDHWPHTGRVFCEEISPCVRVVRDIGARTMMFLVQRVRPGWFYPCTVEDICAVLRHLPPEETGKIGFVVLRQPTRKQRILSPVWGRTVFSFAPDFEANRGGDEAHGGPAVVLEAQCLQPFKWDKSMTPDRRREFERLQQDGHLIADSNHHFFIMQPDEASLRRTQLYRTLLHEIGHHLDYHIHGEAGWKTRTALQREDFAHRYAAEAYAALEEAGVVPFFPLFDAAEMLREGLNPDDFLPPAHAPAEFPESFGFADETPVQNPVA
ncbi:MAG: hypothetical protein FWD77_05490 [Betaproteobacteria bacterium]|nr:hypothetical protein [Betaproteobacteria bacterium]